MKKPLYLLAGLALLPLAGIGQEASSGSGYYQVSTAPPAYTQPAPPPYPKEPIVNINTTQSGQSGSDFRGNITTVTKTVGGVEVGAFGSSQVTNAGVDGARTNARGSESTSTGGAVVETTFP